MEQNTQTLSDYRDRLDATVTAFSLFIGDLCPEARMEISFYSAMKTKMRISGSPFLLTSQQKRVRTWRTN